MKKLFRRGVVFGLAVLPALGALNSTAWANSHLEKNAENAHATRLKTGLGAKINPNIRLRKI